MLRVAADSHCAAARRGSPTRYDIQQAGTSDTLEPEKGRPWRSSCKHEGCFGQHLLLCCAYVGLHTRANTFSETRYKEILTLARQLQIAAILLPVIRTGLRGGPAGSCPRRQLIRGAKTALE
jgi:hypothetical protein